ncbi:MAG: hypothetical protein PVF17_08290 [Ignavibacteria bacterium]|jgi:hypothetical protein
MSNISINDLKLRLEALEKEREHLLALIAIYEGQPIEDNSSKNQFKSTPTSFSVAGRVVDSIIELIHNKSRQVSSKEILDYLEEKGVSLGDTKNKPATLAAILSQEVKKKGARLKKVARGVFDIK